MAINKMWARSMKKGQKEKGTPKEQLASSFIRGMNRSVSDLQNRMLVVMAEGSKK